MEHEPITSKTIFDDFIGAMEVRIEYCCARCLKGECHDSHRDCGAKNVESWIDATGFAHSAPLYGKGGLDIARRWIYSNYPGSVRVYRSSNHWGVDAGRGLFLWGSAGWLFRIRGGREHV